MLILVVLKLPSLKTRILCSKFSKGMGHNSYGEPGWPNDILYIFPRVILGRSLSILGLALHEALEILENPTPFSTPLEILPEWYLFPTFNFLRIFSEKSLGIFSIFYVPTLFFNLAIGENLNRSQNPFQRPRMLSHEYRWTSISRDFARSSLLGHTSHDNTFLISCWSHLYKHRFRLQILPWPKKVFF